MAFEAQHALMCSELAVDDLGYVLLYQTASRLRVTVIQSGSNYGRRDHLSCIGSDQRSDVPQRPGVVRTRADNVGNVLIKRQRLVKCHAKQLHGV